MPGVAGGGGAKGEGAPADVEGEGVAPPVVRWDVERALSVALVGVDTVVPTVDFKKGTAQVKRGFLVFVTCLEVAQPCPVLAAKCVIAAVEQPWPPLDLELASQVVSPFQYFARPVAGIQAERRFNRPWSYGKLRIKEGDCP